MFTEEIFLVSPQKTANGVVEPANVISVLYNEKMDTKLAVKVYQKDGQYIAEVRVRETGFEHFRAVVAQLAYELDRDPNHKSSTDIWLLESFAALCDQNSVLSKLAFPAEGKLNLCEEIVEKLSDSDFNTLMEIYGIVWQSQLATNEKLLALFA